MLHPRAGTAVAATQCQTNAYKRTASQCSALQAAVMSVSTRGCQGGTTGKSVPSQLQPSCAKMYQIEARKMPQRVVRCRICSDKHRASKRVVSCSLLVGRERTCVKSREPGWGQHQLRCRLQSWRIAGKMSNVSVGQFLFAVSQHASGWLYKCRRSPLLWKAVSHYDQQRTLSQLLAGRPQL